MCKQRKLPSYWFVLVGNKRENGSSHKCSSYGYFKVWSCSKTRFFHGYCMWDHVCLWVAESVHTHAPAAEVSLDKVVTQFTLDKGRNGSHSIICKVTCCLLIIFATHILFVFKCFRQPKNKCTSKDAVKMNCLISMT